MFKKFIFTLLLIPQLSLAAGFEFNPTYGIFKTDSEASMSQIEMRMGYTFDFGLFVGGFYSLGSDKQVQHVNNYHVGPMLGYDYKQAYLRAGWVVASESDLASGGTKYGHPTGYQVTLGYAPELFEDVFLGPEFTYRDVKYSDKETQGVPAPIDRHDTYIIPSISMRFKF